MGSRKKNAAKNSSGHQTEKQTPPKQAERTSNGIKQKRGGGETKPRKSSKRSSSIRWVAILLLSGVVAAVAVFYASPDVQQAVNELIIRYTDLDLLDQAPSEGSHHGDNKDLDSVSTENGGSKSHEADDGEQKSNSASNQPEVKVKDDVIKESKQDKPKSDDKKDKEKTSSDREDKAKCQEKVSPQKESQKVETKTESEKTSVGKTDEHSKGDTQRDEGKKDKERTPGEDYENDVPARGGSKMERPKEDHVYSKSDITNTEDFKIRKELDEIDARLDQDLLEDALAKYEGVLDDHPSSPRALYGRAMALDKLSELRRSNEILELSLEAFQKILEVDDVPDKLFKKVGRRLAERQQFRGYGAKASKTFELLTKKFPYDVSLMNELGVSYLMIGHTSDAKDVFRKILKENPRDGFAMVHLGFVLKTAENNPVEAVPYLERGIQSKADGTKDGRFYYHLGDALQRLGNTEKAYKYYKEAASLGLFLSAYQRSLYNVNNLRSHPWWTPRETGHSNELQNLKKHWKEIRDEAVTQMNAESGLFMAEDENLRERGEWKQFTLFQQGRKNKKNCEKMPVTCSLVEKIPDASGCRRGQVKFSVMQPGVHVWPHCGPTNCRIRAHLGLIVPQGPRIRVVNETREWKEGEFIIFDDSFEHEVWHEGEKQRLILIIDLWHPELSEDLKWSLSPI